MRHSPLPLALLLILMALHLVNYFWIFREDHYSAFADRRARWARSTLWWERIVAIVLLLATVAVFPMSKWLLR